MAHDEDWKVVFVDSNLITDGDKEIVHYGISIGGVRLDTTRDNLEELDNHLSSTYPWYKQLPDYPGKSVLNAFIPRSLCNDTARNPERMAALEKWLQAVLKHPECQGDLKVFKLIGFHLPALPEDIDGVDDGPNTALKSNVNLKSLLKQSREAKPDFLPESAMRLHEAPEESRILLADLLVAISVYWRCEDPIVFTLSDGSSTVNLQKEKKKVEQAKKEEADVPIPLIEALLAHIQIPEQVANAMVMNYRLIKQEARKKADSRVHTAWELVPAATRAQQRIAAATAAAEKAEKAEKADQVASAESTENVEKVEKVEMGDEPLPKTMDCIHMYLTNPLVKLSPGLLSHLATLSDDTRKGIVWELLVMSIAQHQGLDADVHTTMQLVCLVLSIPRSWLYQVEEYFAEILFASMADKPGAKNDHNTRSKTRNWKIAAGAALGGTVLLTTGVLAAPILIPAVGGLAVFAAGAAGAVGLTGVATGVTLGGTVLAVGGTPLVASVFGLAGASAFSYQVHRLTKEVSEFMFVEVPLTMPEGASSGVMGAIDSKVEVAVDSLAKLVSQAEVLAVSAVPGGGKAPTMVEQMMDEKSGAAADDEVPADIILDEGELPHAFVEENLKLASVCAVCGIRVWGLGTKSYRCADCKSVFHVGCKTQAHHQACPAKVRKHPKQTEEQRWKAATEPKGDVPMEEPLPDMKPRHKHNFVQASFSKPVWCEICKQFIWGIRKQGMKCTSCEKSVHPKECFAKAKGTTCPGPIKPAKKSDVPVLEKFPSAIAAAVPVPKVVDGGHEYEKSPMPGPTFCKHCDSFIWSPVAFRCNLCKSCVHPGGCVDAAREVCCPQAVSKADVEADEKKENQEREKDMKKVDGLLGDALVKSEQADMAKEDLAKLGEEVEDTLSNIHDDLATLLKAEEEIEKKEAKEKKKKRKKEGKEDKPVAIGGIVKEEDEEPQKRRLGVTICCSGWVWAPQDFKRSWLPVRQAVGHSSEVYSLQWESTELRALGKTLVSMLTSKVVNTVIKYYIAKTILAATMAALAWPLFMLGSIKWVANPWNIVAERANKCGRLLAATLIEQVHGRRPVTLVGFSHGARLILACLVELHRRNALGIVENVFLFGACTHADPVRWAQARKAVSGRLVNAFSTNDWILALLHRTSTIAPTIAGLGPIKCEGVENWNVTHVVSGHLLYKQKISKLLDAVKFTQPWPEEDKLYRKPEEELDLPPCPDCLRAKKEAERRKVSSASVVDAAVCEHVATAGPPMSHVEPAGESSTLAQPGVTPAGPATGDLIDLSAASQQ